MLQVSGVVMVQAIETQGKKNFIGYKYECILICNLASEIMVLNSLIKAYKSKEIFPTCSIRFSATLNLNTIGTLS